MLRFRKILSLENRDGTLMSLVDFGGIQKDVCLEYIPDATVGEYVVVHVGFAIQRLDEESASDTCRVRAPRRAQRGVRRRVRDRGETGRMPTPGNMQQLR